MIDLLPTPWWLLGLLALVPMAIGCKQQPQESLLAKAPVVPPTQSAPSPLPKGHPKSSVVDLGEHGPAICGQIILAPEIKLPTQPSTKRFLIGKSAVTQGILAVQQLHRTATFPQDFCLSFQDLILPGALFQGSMLLQIRMDQDGDPLTEQSGDVSGALLQPVLPGAERVRLVLDQVIP